jgi:hypothetical protein
MLRTCTRGVLDAVKPARLPYGDGDQWSPGNLSLWRRPAKGNDNKCFHSFGAVFPSGSARARQKNCGALAFTD